MSKSGQEKTPDLYVTANLGKEDLLNRKRGVAKVMENYRIEKKSETSHIELGWCNYRNLI